MDTSNYTTRQPKKPSKEAIRKRAKFAINRIVRENLNFYSKSRRAFVLDIYSLHSEISPQSKALSELIQEARLLRVKSDERFIEKRFR